jgi:hypothetical protein
MPACSNNCLLIRQPVGNFPPPIPVVRQVHAYCIICNGNVSEYGHRVCYQCAQPNDPEFDHHHHRCRVNAQAPMTSYSAEVEEAPTPN